jgi:hypothetical protein
MLLFAANNLTAVMAVRTSISISSLTDESIFGKPCWSNENVYAGFGRVINYACINFHQNLILWLKNIFPILPACKEVMKLRVEPSTRYNPLCE